MNGQPMLCLAVVALFGIGQALRGQSEPKEGPRLDLGNVGAIPQIYVSLRLRAPDKQIFVPYCGQSKIGTWDKSLFAPYQSQAVANTTRILCTAGTHLQVRSGAEWVPAGARTTFGILGRLPLDLADGVLIAPGSELSFEYEFSRRYFQVEPGQLLRVIVDLWPDEESMKSGRPSTKIASPPFECPQDVPILPPRGPLR
jgi:hypothetical protein